MATALKANLSDPVTSHMRTDVTRLFLSQTVSEALDWLRSHPPPGRIIYFYVVDADDHLLGVVPTRRLVLSPLDSRVADIMVHKVATLNARATVAEACEFFILHRFLAFPVVDDVGKLVGMVDVELYTDELREVSDASERDNLFQLIGVHLAGTEDRSPLFAFRQRFPWLGCNLAAGILAAVLSGLYEEVLSNVVALAFFIPVVLNLAESVSTQSVSLALQFLEGHRPTWRVMLPRLRDELLTGLMLGLGSGAIMALVAMLWLGKGDVALCLAGGIAGGVAGAAVLGLIIPVLLRLFRLEPRVAAGPIALAGADVITILIYLNLARWLLAG
jgi:magnesium transporter